MANLEVRPVADDEWDVLAWLWQCFKHDLALIVGGLPYADGRYQTGGLPTSSADTAAYLARRPHPKTGKDAPIGFAVVDVLDGERRHLAAFWVAPVARRGGVGMELALEVIGRHPGAWRVAFQHDNAPAGAFWRRLADEAFGPDGWREVERPVPGLAAAPPDHWIETV